MSMLVRIVHALMVLLFMYAAAVNFNDPDWYWWVPLYGAAAVIAAGAAWRADTVPWIAPAAVSLIALVWAARLAPQVIGKVRFGELWVEEGMKTIQIELGREFYGLLIVVVWMALVAIPRLLAARAR